MIWRPYGFVREGMQHRTESNASITIRRTEAKRSRACKRARASVEMKQCKDAETDDMMRAVVAVVVPVVVAVVALLVVAVVVVATTSAVVRMTAAARGRRGAVRGI